jgi:hypothetical protein
MERDDVAAPALSKAEERLPEPQQRIAKESRESPPPPYPTPHPPSRQYKEIFTDGSSDVRL